MNKTGVVFVHGLTGGESTWKNSKGLSFSDLLKKDKSLEENYKFIEFEYYTEILSIFDSALVQKLMGIIKIPKFLGYKSKIKANQPIDRLSGLLNTSLRIQLSDCNEVIIIAHSLGGLIAKDYILNHKEGIGPKPIGYISMAVPHKGSLPALILGPFNLNAKQLVPLNEYVDQLNMEWAARKDILPDSIYLISLHDECVPLSSSIPYKIEDSQKYILDSDHTSICKPETLDDPVYLTVNKFLNDHAHKKLMRKLASATYTSDDPTYDKEIFVIKMILCDIGEKAIDDAKECFFHAEVISKAANKLDQLTLSDLQNKVLSIYRQTYNQYSAKGETSNEIFAQVHKAILNQDSTSLKVGVDYINFLHKKGLLHQLANKLNTTVVWSDSTNLNDVKNSL